MNKFSQLGDCISSGGRTPNRLSTNTEMTRLEFVNLRCPWHRRDIRSQSQVEFRFQQHNCSCVALHEHNSLGQKICEGCFCTNICVFVPFMERGARVLLANLRLGVGKCAVVQPVNRCLNRW